MWECEKSAMPTNRQGAAGSTRRNSVCVCCHFSQKVSQIHLLHTLIATTRFKYSSTSTFLLVTKWNNNNNKKQCQKCLMAWWLIYSTAFTNSEVEPSNSVRTNFNIKIWVRCDNLFKISQNSLDLLVVFMNIQDPNPPSLDTAASYDKWWETSIPMCDRQKLAE